MKMKNKGKSILRIVLLVFFVGIFAAGYLNGEVNTVLTKAVNICMECIGIG